MGSGCECCPPARLWWSDHSSPWFCGACADDSRWAAGCCSARPELGGAGEVPFTLQHSPARSAAHRQNRDRLFEGCDKWKDGARAVWRKAGRVSNSQKKVEGGETKGWKREEQEGMAALGIAGVRPGSTTVGELLGNHAFAEIVLGSCSLQEGLETPYLLVCLSFFPSPPPLSVCLLSLAVFEFHDSGVWGVSVEQVLPACPVLRPITHSHCRPPAAPQGWRQEQASGSEEVLP